MSDLMLSQGGRGSPSRLGHATAMLSDSRFNEYGPRSGLTLSSVLASAWRRRYIFMIVALATFGAAAGIIFTLQPRYESTALLMVDPRQTSVATLEAVQEGSTTSLGDLNFVRTQMQMLTSDELASRVVTQLGLQNEMMFSQPSSLSLLLARGYALLSLSAKPQQESPENALEHAIERYKSQFGAFTDGKSFIIGVAFSAADPAFAQQVLAAHLTIFQNLQIAAKRKVINQAQAWFTNELQAMQEKLRADERQQQAFRRSNQLLTTGGETIPARELAAITNQLSEASADLGRKEARLREIGAAGGADTAVLSSDLIQRLRQQEATAAQTVAQMSRNYSSGYPALIGAQDSLASIRQKISQETQRLTTSAASDVFIARANVSRLQAELQILNSKLGETRSDELVATQTDRDIEAERRLYEDLLLRNKRVSIQAQLQEPDTRVVSAATLPATAAFPRRGILLATSTVAAMIAGGLAAFLAELLGSRKITSLSEVEGGLGIAGLAVIPQLPRRKTVARAATDTYLAASLQMLRNSIIFRSGNRDPKVTVFASALPGEGKTVLALLYACSLAAEGRRVLIVDADLRRAGLTKLTKLDRRAGLADCLRGRQISECTVTDAARGVDILPVGVAMAGACHFLASERVSELFSSVTHRYDAVVIDTPPIGVVDDALHIVAQADATVLVARWNRTRSSALKNAVARLGLANGNVVGVALTAVDISKYRSCYASAGGLVHHPSYYTSLS